MIYYIFCIFQLDYLDTSTFHSNTPVRMLHHDLVNRFRISTDL